MVSLSVASLNTHRSVRSPLAAEQLRPPPTPAASALYPDARGNERERLMGRIPRMPMGPLTSQPARHPRSRSSRRRRRRARRGPGLLPPGLEPRKRCGRAVDGQHPLSRNTRTGVPGPEDRHPLAGADVGGGAWKERTLEALLTQRPLARRHVTSPRAAASPLAAAGAPPPWAPHLPSRSSPPHLAP